MLMQMQMLNVLMKAMVVGATIVLRGIQWVVTGPAQEAPQAFRMRLLPGAFSSPKPDLSLTLTLRLCLQGCRPGAHYKYRKTYCKH